MCVAYCAFSLCSFVLCIPERVSHMINQSISNRSVVVVTKIVRYRSRVLGICACCNYHESVDIGEKLVSVCFELLNMAH